MKQIYAAIAIVLMSAALAFCAEKSGTITTSDGVKLHYIEAGQGPAILFIPGWTMPAEIWRPQIDNFSQHYRVVAVDPRSQGDSDKPMKGNYSERRSRDYKELIGALKLSPAVLVGWSMGVPEVLSYLQQSGGQTVRAAVLVDGRLGPAPEFDKAIRGWMAMLQKDRQKFAAGFIPSMFKKPQSQTYLQKIATDSTKTPDDTAVTLIYNMIGEDYWTFVEKIRPVYYAITPPMKEQGDLLKAQLPAARVEVFEDAGHALFVDDAERLITASTTSSKRSLQNETGGQKGRLRHIDMITSPSSALCSARRATP